MNVTEKKHWFKVGFAQKLAERGILPSELTGDFPRSWKIEKPASFGSGLLMGSGMALGAVGTEVAIDAIRNWKKKRAMLSPAQGVEKQPEAPIMAAQHGNVGTPQVTPDEPQKEAKVGPWLLKKMRERKGECVECGKAKCSCTAEKKAMTLPGESLVAPVVSGAVDLAKEPLQNAYAAARDVALVAPAAVPGIAGYIGNSLDRVSKDDLNALQEADLVLAYRRASAELRRRQALHGKVVSRGY